MLAPSAILAQVQALQRNLLMEEHRVRFARAWNWVDAHLIITYGEDADIGKLLRQVLTVLISSVHATGMWYEALMTG